jgi:aromatic-L-amino-acid decarboxylase
VDEVMLPDLPAVSFDWDPETWEKAAQRAVQLAVDVSTGWEHRRPVPEEPPDRILKRFGEPLPRSPVPFEAIADRLEELASLSTFIGHPRWFAYITSSPNPVGVVGDFVTSAINPNIGLWRGGRRPRPSRSSRSTG